MPSIPVGGQTPPSFSNIVDAFANKADDKHVRYSDAKGLYTSQKGSLTAIKAFFGFTDAMQARETKRSMAFDQIRGAIDREYGAGMADKVFKHMMSSGHDLTRGLTAGDLRSIQADLEHTLQFRGLHESGNLLNAEGVLDRPDLDQDYTSFLSNQSPTERARLEGLEVVRSLGLPLTKIDVALLTESFVKLQSDPRSAPSQKIGAVLDNYTTMVGKSGNVDELIGATKTVFGYYAKAAADLKINVPTSNPEGSFMREKQGKAVERAAAPLFAETVSAMAGRVGTYPDTDLQPARKIDRLVDPKFATTEQLATANKAVEATAIFVDEGLSRLFGGSDKQAGRDLAATVGDDAARIFAAMVDAVGGEAQRVGGSFETEITTSTIANAFALRQLNPALVDAASTLGQPKKAQMLELSAALQFVANGVNDPSKFEKAYGDVIAKYFPAMEGFHEALLERGRQLNA